MTADWDGPPWRIVAKGLLKVPGYPAFLAIFMFRLSSAIYRIPPLRPFAHLCKAVAIAWCGAEIHPAAKIGPGFALVHSVGIVIGHEVRAGRDLVVYQGVTIGHDGKRSGQAQIGDRVRVYAGAKILGPVQVGDGAQIGANAVILADVRSGQTVSGIWRGHAPRADQTDQIGA
jgi:serine O-acetyltransferase